MHPNIAESTCLSVTENFFAFCERGKFNMNEWLNVMLPFNNTINCLTSSFLGHIQTSYVGKISYTVAHAISSTWLNHHVHGGTAI